MGAFCSTSLPASSVWTGYFITIALVCAGLQASTNDMYYLIRMTECAPGTSPTFPPPPGVPFCNRDAWSSSTDRVAQAFGTTSTSYNDYSVFTGNGGGQISYFCVPAPNSTCPLQSKMPYSSGSAQMRVTEVLYQLPDRTMCDPSTVANGCAAVLTVDSNQFDNFVMSMAGSLASLLHQTRATLNNIPVKFSAQSLPVGLTSTTTYYLRAHGSGFALAVDMSSQPLRTITIPATMPTDLVMTMPVFDSCPFQAKQASIRPSNLNADGSVKAGACGYCLSNDQQINMTAAVGLPGAAVALLALILIFSRIQFTYKLRFFKPVAIFFSVVAWLFLLGAVVAGFFGAISVAACSSLMSAPLPDADISAIYALTGNGLPKVGDYVPVTAKSVPTNVYARKQSEGQANFECRTGQGVACYNNVIFLPGPGTIFYVVAIVFLLLFLIFIGIKVDFSLSAASSGNAMVSAVNMKPVVTPGRDVYL